MDFTFFLNFCVRIQSFWKLKSGLASPCITPNRDLTRPHVSGLMVKSAEMMFLSRLWSKCPASNLILGNILVLICSHTGSSRCLFYRVALFFSDHARRPGVEKVGPCRSLAYSRAQRMAFKRVLCLLLVGLFFPRLHA